MIEAINWFYILAAFLFALGLKQLSSPATARRGNLLSATAMLIAVGVTLFDQQIIDFRWILGGVLLGATIGLLAARLVAMTAMPEMVALLNGFGGVASLLVGWGEYVNIMDLGSFVAVATFLAVLIGGVTFSGSLIAWAKLRDFWIGNFGIGKPILFRGQQVFNSMLLLAILISGVMFALDPVQGYTPFLIVIALALLLGIMAVIPIGGADMPVVISLLNSYSGLAACAAGFVIQNNILIVAGSMVGAAGLILTSIMCKAMNRSLSNVLFSGFGSVVTAGSDRVEGEVKPISASDSYLLLEASSSVVFVPGYGLAVAQAQHAVRELSDLLENNGCEVRFAIHPVAGRMPGHMNVLLAEADVPYDQLVEMDDINPSMDSVDVCVVIGANDVVNPAAKEDEASPIYGMPIIEVERARTVIVMKRSMATGFAGIENPLFYKSNTRMLFGDAKKSLQALVAEFKQ
ncbi:MAG TPA: NAD(P)(+) transhydrogenase (Re/Si-specific) subunit beta [Acidobacteriota bacterium]|nr:NAD(P)(+) transhydrogenase (Re/Si-specific) subunit beta [Acidobacteriota bacterium]